MESGFNFGKLFGIQFRVHYSWFFIFGLITVFLALDPEKFRRVRGQRATSGSACSMCGQYCAMDLVGQYLGVKATRC